MKMRVDETGTILAAEGDAESVFGMTSEEMVGLPLSIFNSDPLTEGLGTRLCKHRSDLELPVHFAMFPSEDGGYEIWAEGPLGDIQIPMKMRFQQTLFHGLAFSAEYGDPSLQSHLHRVSKYTAFLAERYLKHDPIDVQRLSTAAYSHDIGKAAIPRELLFKPARLAAEERKLIQIHTENGAAMIENIEIKFRESADWMIDHPTFELAKDIALYHHENWNGTGYPHGKKGNDIPLAARLVKLVDVVDALLTSRTYKTAWEWPDVRNEIESLSGVEFDPDLAAWFLEHEEEFLAVRAQCEVIYS